MAFDRSFVETEAAMAALEIGKCFVDVTSLPPI